MSDGSRTQTGLRGPISLYHGAENSDKMNEWQQHETEVIKKEYERKLKRLESRQKNTP